jgi:ABC-type transport system involved in multi-copper enzyme maturation permease subunit
VNLAKVKLLWEELVLANPMFAEVSRKWRKFTLGATTRVIGISWLFLFGFALLGVFQFSILLAQPKSGLWIALTKIVILTLATPFMTHGVIAAEREKRTWDSLVSAPVTIGQIVFGKFAGIVTVITLVFAVVFPLEVVAPISSLFMPKNGMFYQGPNATVYDVADGLFSYARLNWYGFTFCLAWAAINFFFSARSKRALSALAASIAVLFVFSVATGPMVFVSDAATSSIVIAPFSPITMARLLSESSGQLNEYFLLKVLPEFSSLILLLITGLFLFYSFKTVTFADREVKFLPKRPNARS